jgi:hypothetical protein
MRPGEESDESSAEDSTSESFVNLLMVFTAASKTAIVYSKEGYDVKIGIRKVPQIKLQIAIEYGAIKPKVWLLFRRSYKMEYFLSFGSF